MAYGQYSVGGGERRNKSALLDVEALQGLDLDRDTARKAGHNRLVVSGRNGARYFVLHETIVATLSPEGDRLELADGGWPTPTTRKAWDDAVSAFKVGGPAYAIMPKKTERSVVYRRASWISTFWEREPEQKPADPMIRASVESEQGSFCVRYDGKHLISEAGVKVRATPFKVLTVLYRIDKLAKAMKGRFAMRGYALDFASFEALGGYTVSCGQTSRQTMIGCHTFKTAEIRDEMRRIEGLYPAAVKPAKRWIKLNPTDFGIAARDAEEARRLAEYRALYVQQREARA